MIMRCVAYKYKGPAIACRQHMEAAEKGTLLLKLGLVLLFSAAAFHSARAQDKDTSGEYVHSPGFGTYFLLDNSFARADFGEVFSFASSTVGAHFWAYQLKTEFAAWENYVVQASFLTGKSYVDVSGSPDRSMSNTIFTVGVGYRFSGGFDVSTAHSYLKHGTIAFARYRYIRHITDLNNGIASSGLQIGLEASYPQRIRFIVVDAGIWLTVLDSFVPKGQVSSPGETPQTLGLNLGVGVALSQYATLVVSEELNQQIPKVFRSRYRILRLTLRTML